MDSRSAFADESPHDPASAEALFTAAQSLMDQKRYAEACPRFETSMALDPGTGTLLNLALCHEAIGKIATAWAEFREVAVRAERVGRTDRVTMARQHEGALAERLSHVTIVVPLEAHVKGLAVSVDGVERPDGSWDDLPIDPGAHHLEATAPAKIHAIVDFTIGETKSDQKVTVPVLADPPKPVSPPPVDQTGRRVASYIAGGVGLALIAGGSVFGVMAIQENDKARVGCDGTINCPRGARDESNTAMNEANVANVGIIVGALALGAGAYLWITSRARVAPQIGPNSAGISMQGTF